MVVEQAFEPLRRLLDYPWQPRMKVSLTRDGGYQANSLRPLRPCAHKKTPRLRASA
jgi:hypothetical protein